MSASRRHARLLLLLLLAAAMPACVRPIEVGSEPRPSYRLVVENTIAEPMIVSYTDARGEALLGTVAAGSSQEFAIAAPATGRIAVSARNVAGTRSFGPFTVDLVAGARPTVRLR